MMFLFRYILIVLLWPSMAFCDEPYSLLWKHYFDSTIVKTSMVKDFISRSSDFPLNHVVTKKHLIELDIKTKKEKICTLKPYDIVKVADNRCIAVGVKKNVISVFNIDKEMASFKINKTVLIPEHLIMDISPDGAIIVILSWFHKTISFYTIKGRLLNSYTADDVKGAVIQFSKNSKRVVIHVPNYGDGSSNGYLMCYDSKGTFLWRFDHPGCQAQYDLSSDGKFVILYANQTLYSLHKGKTIYEINMVSPEILARISNDGAHAALARKSDHCIYYIDNQNGITLWKQRISGFDFKNSPFTDMEVRQDVVAVAISKHWSRRNQESWVNVFNKKGKKIWDKQFEQYALDISFSINATILKVFGENAVYLYRSSFKK